MTKPVVLILGGQDKENDYTLLKDLVKEKVKAIVCLGIDNKKIHKCFKKEIEIIVDAKTMDEAVNISYHLADKGDVVLLSPGSASFDLFKNFEERGLKFKEAVRDL